MVTFTRRSNGQNIDASHINELQIKLEDALGRSTILVHDDFSRLSNGSISGVSPLIGSNPWAVSGTVLPLVTSGTVYSTGSGYLYSTTTSKPTIVEAEFSFAGVPASGSITLAICREGGGNLLNSFLHLILGPENGTLTVRSDGGTFYDSLSPSWAPIKTDSTHYRMRLAVYESMVAIVGPNGELFATYDPRAKEALGTAHNAFYLQASSTARLHSVTVLGETTDKKGSLLDRLTGTTTANKGRDRVIGGEHSVGQVTIGAGKSSFNPTIGLGVYGYQMRTQLSAAASIGATTISVPYPMYGFTSLTLGIGATEEVVTVSSTTGTGPFTITVSALTKAHALGSAVWGDPTSSAYYAEIFLNMGNGLIYMPSNTVLQGTTYIGSNLDVTISRPVANVFGVGGDDAIRTGKSVTGSRPSASAVTEGSMFYDTTLHKPIWSDGTDWRDAAGTVV